MESNLAMNSREKGSSYFLDITNDVCPLTFVRSKLLLERLSPGDIAEIRLTGSEPLANVPRSLSEDGHQILSLAPEEEDAGDAAIYRLVVRRGS
jgi:TusA-related sulfurtransferase